MISVHRSERRMSAYRGTAAALAGACAGAVVMVVVLAGCGAKAREPFKDAPRGATNSTPADTVTFPDGFSNVATKCDHGNRVYVAYHGDEIYAAIAVVPNDPSCAR